MLLLFQATGTRVLPWRACPRVLLSRSVPETADHAETRGVREASTGDDVHLITDHAVLCPFLHSLLLVTWVCLASASARISRLHPHVCDS